MEIYGPQNLSATRQTQTRTLTITYTHSYTHTNKQTNCLYFLAFYNALWVENTNTIFPSILQVSCFTVGMFYLTVCKHVS